MLYKKRVITAATLAAAAFAHGGTVIDTNLSAGTVAIVNIDAQADGAATYSGNNQDFWQAPFNVNGNPLEVTLSPGTYKFQLVDLTDALAANPGLTASQQGEIYTAWTFNSPWATDYEVFDSGALTNTSEDDLFAGAVSANIPNYGSYAGAGPLGFDNATDAYNAAVAGGIYDKIWLDGRYSGPEQSSYTVTSTETFVFVIPDYYLPDNNGGDSVMISQAVPEPASALVLAPVALLGLRRRKR